MPFLNISQEAIARSDRKDPADFDRNWRTWWRIYSVMLIDDREPNAEDKRRRTELAFFAASTRKRLEQLTDEETFRWDRQAGLDLIAGAAEMSIVEKEERVKVKYGRLAGGILITFVGAVLSDKTTNLNDCKAEVEKHLRVSRSTIDNSAWGGYRNVSHLWAAMYTLSEPDPHFPRTPASPCRFFPDRCMLSHFLGLAETFRKYGESSWPVADAILYPGETWAVPLEIALPRFELRF